ncbi:MAG: hypothetical protein BWZ10_02234 [candidate division BRC1 bacterium ADurb.BinA364]|nr:MAG: hypothetical protein BWZ10_02234 [candidate division BRC1 bacterium ADurb.BinA364]
MEADASRSGPCRLSAIRRRPRHRSRSSRRRRGTGAEFLAGAAKSRRRRMPRFHSNRLVRRGLPGRLFGALLSAVADGPLAASQPARRLCHSAAGARNSLEKKAAGARRRSAGALDRKQSDRTAAVQKLAKQQPVRRLPARADPSGGMAGALGQARSDRMGGRNLRAFRFRAGPPGLGRTGWPIDLDGHFSRRRFRRKRS